MSNGPVRDTSARPPKVSVCVITYNQERYIGQCLQTIVDQQTNFQFEIIVGDDNSTDGTQAIIKEYANRYPSIIHPIYQPINKFGGCHNFRVVHLAAIGTYIAHVDGDDYILPGKLQVQADFLDKYPCCSVVGHQAIVLDENNKLADPSSRNQQPKFSTIKRLLKKHAFFIQSSKMYRRNANVDHSAIYDDFFIDFNLHIEHASRGLIGFINKPFVVYRKHTQSISSAKGSGFHNLIDMTIKSYYDAIPLGVKAVYVRAMISRYTVRASLFCLERGDVPGFNRYLTISNNLSSVSSGILSLFISCLRFNPGLQKSACQLLMRLKQLAHANR